jgi:outer membrane protein
MKSLVLVCVVASVGFAQTVREPDTRAVALKEAVGLALERNADLKVAQAKAMEVSAQARHMVAVGLPDLALSASGVLTSAPAILDNGGQLDLLSTLVRASNLPPPAQTPILDGLSSSPRSIPIQARESAFGSLVLTQVLFSPQFFLFPAIADSKEAARLANLEAKNQIVLAVAKAFVGVEGLRALEAAALEAETVALRREKDALARVQVGTSTDIDVFRAQTETLTARSTSASLKGARLGLLALLEALTGEPIRPLDNAQTLLELQAATGTDDVWLQAPALAAAAKVVQVEETFERAASLAWLPTLVAQGKGNFNSNKGFANTNWTADGILSLQWSLYDRGIRYANIKEREAKLAGARAELDSAKAKAKANWVASKANLEAAAVALAQAESQAALASKAQKQLDSVFKAGLVSSLEMFDIDNKRFLAASAAAQAKAQLEIRKLELAAAEGRLGEAIGLAEVSPR